MSIRPIGRKAAAGVTPLLCLLLLLGCGDGAENYFPLEPKRYWQYAVTRTTMDGEVRQKYLIAAAAPQVWNKRTVSVQQTLDGHQYFYAADGAGIVQVARKLAHEDAVTATTPARTVLPKSQTPGVRWQRDSETMVLESSGPPWETLFQLAHPIELTFVIESKNGTVSVPAGEFDNCLVIVGAGEGQAEIGDYIGSAMISIVVKQWYARDVGLVKIERVETSDAPALKQGRLLMALESYR